MRRRIIRGVTLHIFLYLLQGSASEKECPAPVPKHLFMVKETDPEGLVLFQINNASSVFLWTYRISNPLIYDIIFRDYFTLVKEGNSWIFKLAKILDIEIIFRDKRINIDGVNIEFVFKCSDVVEKNWVTFARQIIVTSVDEFQPLFTTSIIKIAAPEGKPVNTHIVNLNKFVTDFDLELYSSNHSRFFSINPLPYPTADSRGKFILTWFGEIIVKETVDYEQGERYYEMNISVENSKHMKSFALIQITIENINDHSPTFMYIGCNWDCVESLYVTTVQGCFLGLLEQFKYGPINAIDLDDEPVNYRIAHASPPGATSFVKLREANGQLEVFDYLQLLNSHVVIFAIEAFDTKVLKTADGEFGSHSRFTSLMLVVMKDVC